MYYLLSSMNFYKSATESHLLLLLITDFVILRFTLTVQDWQTKANVAIIITDKTGFALRMN